MGWKGGERGGELVLINYDILVYSNNFVKLGGEAIYIGC